MSAMYDLVWASLEVWHGMADGDCGRARSFILGRLQEGDADALKSCRDFAEACKKEGIAFDLDYDLD
jgi:hypothetical protein